jgi:predicted phage tail protein
LVVINTVTHSLYSGLGVNANWTNGTWTGDMVQLVVCVPASKSTKTADCGQYYNSKWGVGEVLLYRRSVTVTVIRTDTGATVQTKAISGYAMSCNASFSGAGIMKYKPPWKIYGGEPTGAQINSYATGMSK